MQSYSRAMLSTACFLFTMSFNNLSLWYFLCFQVMFGLLANLTFELSDDKNYRERKLSGAHQARLVDACFIAKQCMY